MYYLGGAFFLVLLAMFVAHKYGGNNDKDKW